LSEEEQAAGRTILTCVSRAVRGAITIDTGFRADPRPYAGAEHRAGSAGGDRPTEGAGRLLRPKTG
jgi:hypothetical protein